MKTKQLVKNVSIALVVPFALALFFISGRSFAIQCPDGTFLPDAQAAQCGQATPESSDGTVTPFEYTQTKAAHICGSNGTPNDAAIDPPSDNENEVHVAFDFGCLGDEYNKPLNPIVDVAFAIFRFLSVGVGLVVIGSVIVAGIQYTTSRGNPQATQVAIKRMTSAIIGLVIYMFIFALANFLIPGGMFIS